MISGSPESIKEEVHVQPVVYQPPLLPQTLNPYSVMPLRSGQKQPGQNPEEIELDAAPQQFGTVFNMPKDTYVQKDFDQYIEHRDNRIEVKETVADIEMTLDNPEDDQLKHLVQRQLEEGEAHQKQVLEEQEGLQEDEYMEQVLPG